MKIKNQLLYGTLLTAILFIMSISILSGTDVFPEVKAKITISKSKQAELYKDFLKESSAKTDFIYLDINRDGTKELITRYQPGSYSDYDVYVYTIKNGKIKKLSKKLTISHIYSKNSILLYNKSLKAISSVETGSYSISYQLWRMKGTKLVEAAKCNNIFGRYPVCTIGRNDKSCSKAAYNSYFKKYFSSAEKYKFRNNTPAKRKKYIK